MNITNISQRFFTIKLNHIFILFGIIMLLASLLTLNSFFRYFNPDEFEVIHNAWKIWKGERPYIDYFEHHHPLSWFLVIPLFFYSGETILTVQCARIVFLFIALMILFITFLFAKNLYSTSIGLISVCLLGSFQLFLDHVIEIRPDIPQIACNLISLFLLHRFLVFKKKESFIASSIALSFSLLFLQKAIFFIIPMGFFFLICLYKKLMTCKEFLIYWGIFSIPLLIYGCYLLMTHSFYQYWYFNWYFNLVAWEKFVPYEYLIVAYAHNTLIWFFYLLFLLFYAQNFYEKSISNLTMIFIFFFVTLMRTPYPHYLLPILPLVAILAARSLYLLFKDNKSMLVIVLLATIIKPLISQIIFLKELKKNNFHDNRFEKIAYVLQNTTADDYVFDGESSFNLYRKDVDFFWFSTCRYPSGLTSYQKLTGYQFNIYELIGTYRPKIICVRDVDINHSVIANSYIKTQWPELYILKT